MADTSLFDAFVSFGVDDDGELETKIRDFETQLEDLTSGDQLVSLSVDTDGLEAAQTAIDGISDDGTRASSEIDRLAQGFSDLALASNEINDVLIDASALRETAANAAIAEQEAREVAAALAAAEAEAEQLDLTVRQIAIDLDGLEVQGIGDGFRAAAGDITKMGFESGNANAAVSRLSGSSGRLNNFLFQTANAAQDAQFGFQAIANNIPVLIDSYSRLSAESGGLSGIFSDIGASAKGLVGSITPVSAAFAGVAAVGVGAFFAINAEIKRSRDLSRQLRSDFESIVDLIGSRSFADLGVDQLESQLDNALDALEDGEEAAAKYRQEMTLLGEIFGGVDYAGLSQGTEVVRRLQRQLQIAKEEAAALAVISASETLQIQFDLPNTQLRDEIEDLIEQTQGNLSDVEIRTIYEGVALQEFTDSLKKEASSIAELVGTTTADVVGEINSQISILAGSASDLSSEAKAAAEAIELINAAIQAPGTTQAQNLEYLDQIDQIEAALAGLEQATAGAEFSKNLEKEADAAIDKFEKLADSTKTFEDRVREMGDVVAEALRFDVDLGLDQALLVFESQLDSLLDKELGKIAKLQSTTVSGLNAQIGTQAEQSALTGLRDVNAAILAQQTAIAERAERRNDILEVHTQKFDALKDALDEARFGEGGGIAVIDNISL